MVIPAKPKEPYENRIVNAQTPIPPAEFENIQITQNAPLRATDEGSYSMPFLDAQGRRVAELGYGVRMLSQSFIPLSSIEIGRFGKTMFPPLGGVGMPRNIDSQFSAPNLHPLDQRIQYNQNNSRGDYVDHLAPHDPAMAFWKRMREITNLYANE